MFKREETGSSPLKIGNRLFSSKDRKQGWTKGGSAAPCQTELSRPSRKARRQSPRLGKVADDNFSFCLYCLPMARARACSSSTLQMSLFFVICQEKTCSHFCDRYFGGQARHKAQSQKKQMRVTGPSPPLEP